MTTDRTSVTRFAKTTGADLIRTPYKSQSTTPMLKMRKVRAETSLPDLLAWIFSNCGTNATVVRTPATEPIRSFIVPWSDIVVVNRIRSIRYRSLRRRRAPDDAVCGRKPRASGSAARAAGGSAVDRPPLHHRESRVLRIALGLAGRWSPAPVVARGIQVARAAVVGQSRLHHLAPQPLPKLGVPHREHQLHPAVEVARHPVRGGEEHLLFSFGPEEEDAVVLEKPADDGEDPDVLRQPLRARPQAADSANLEVDLRSRLRGRVERFDDLGVDQRVHLDKDARLLARAGALCLLADQGQEPRRERVRRHRQLAVGGPGEARKSVEKLAHVLADLLRAG